MKFLDEKVMDIGGYKADRRLARDVADLCIRGCLCLGDNKVVLQLLLVQGMLKGKTVVGPY